MAIDYQFFKGNYHGLTVQNKSVEILVDDALEIIGKYNFIDQHKEFYAKNLFNEEAKLLYFFTENQLIEIGINLENVSLEAIDYKKITNVKMTFFTHNHYSLEMKLEDGREIVLDNRLDTNSNTAYSFINKIKNIHTMLVGDI